MCLSVVVVHCCWKFKHWASFRFKFSTLAARSHFFSPPEYNHTRASAHARTRAPKPFSCWLRHVGSSAPVAFCCAPPTLCLWRGGGKWRPQTWSICDQLQSDRRSWQQQSRPDLYRWSSLSQARADNGRGKFQNVSLINGKWRTTSTCKQQMFVPLRGSFSAAS